MLDNGAFSHWRKGGQVDVARYAEWVTEWHRHPAYDFCLIPDSVDGGEAENDDLLREWTDNGMTRGVPVYHLHESLDRLERLMADYPRIALGSSGEYSSPGAYRWWERMAEVMAVVCDKHGRPLVRLHGLRMLSPTIFAHVPLASADSTNVARNIGIDKAWSGPYRPVTNAQRALVLAERIEHHATAARWNAAAWGQQHNLELIG